MKFQQKFFSFDGSRFLNKPSTSKAHRNTVLGKLEGNLIAIAGEGSGGLSSLKYYQNKSVHALYGNLTISLSIGADF